MFWRHQFQKEMAMGLHGGQRKGGKRADEAINVVVIRFGKNCQMIMSRNYSPVIAQLF